jgi:hypothetical protein
MEVLKFAKCSIIANPLLTNLELDPSVLEAAKRPLPTHSFRRELEVSNQCCLSNFY